MEIRESIVNAINAEIVGPSNSQYYRDPASGEEILLSKIHGTPRARYGAGMLYPRQTTNTEELDDPENESSSDLLEVTSTTDSTEMSNRNEYSTEAGVAEEEPVGLANQYLPSAMGFTVRINALEKNDALTIRIKSAQYVKGSSQIEVKRIVDGKAENVVTKDGPMLSDYWVRRPIDIDEIKGNLGSFLKSKVYSQVLFKSSKGQDWLKLQIFDRTTSDDAKDHCMTVTFVIINCLTVSTDDSLSNSDILFQNELSITTESDDLIAPYRERTASTDTEEEKELNLLYRKKRIFGVGHGSSVRWVINKGRQPVSANQVCTATVPVCDIPQVAPTSHVELSMFELSNFGDWNQALAALESIAVEYGTWIQTLENQTNSADMQAYRDAAQINIGKCVLSLSRIRKGIDLLKSAEADSDLVKAFRWMNQAMIWQQQRSKIKQRKWIRVKNGDAISYQLETMPNGRTRPDTLKDFHDASRASGRWRPFQLAFILMNIPSVIDPKSTDREVIDLIWFPTGGGKTEAYLGLAAMSIFYRRLKGRKDFNWKLCGGTAVIMRYTLRLLTTQQYERAASMICACDLIRQKSVSDLGDEPISIGLWVGGKSTPNDNEKAREQFRQLNRSKYEAYNFIVMKCPCCGAQIGKLENASREEKVRVKGLKQEDGRNGKIRFQCENTECEYALLPLPLMVVDEDIYGTPPTLLLGTVDKFAMLPWKREFQHGDHIVDSSCLFGFRNGDGQWTRITPPELIIQDELHLISGPLGTMVGLYEAMIQNLCLDFGLQKPPFYRDSSETDAIKPKIVASSATISRAFDQVRSLYGISDRSHLHLFPSQGLEFGNTWFSEEKSLLELDDNGEPRFPGRRYVGLLTSGYPSAQTSIVRSYSSILQTVKELDEQRSVDYYWTLMGYFNSIRELGGASSLVFGDIRERLTQIQNRDLIQADKRRRLFDRGIQELTSRIDSSEIPEVLKRLEEGFKRSNSKCIDICLATNMVATGVDISRLGLMVIHGQPKTTSEYIQASSRVGRELPHGPGLVFALYSPSKPRDKSQYEQFQGFHNRIYSHVEPTSVTPFSINARERALHAVFIGLIRFFSGGPLRSSARTDVTEFGPLTASVKKMLVARCAVVDPGEVTNASKQIDHIIDFWKSRGVQHYGDGANYGILHNDGYYPLMYATSSEVKDEIISDKRSLATPTSMRGVDTESVITIH